MHLRVTRTATAMTTTITKQTATSTPEHLIHHYKKLRQWLEMKHLTIPTLLDIYSTLYGELICDDLMILYVVK